MEDETDLMSIFGDNHELNFQINDDDLNDQDDEIIEDNNLNDKPIEEDEDSPEDVDRDEDNANEEDDISDDNSPNLYSSIADVLFEQGVIPSLESSKEIKSVDDFVNVFKNEIVSQSERRLEEYLNNLDLEKIAVSKKTQVELESIDEDYLKDNLDVAKDLIYRDYLNQGLSEDRARKMLRKTIDLGEDIILEDALESIQSLKEFESKQIEVEKARYAQSLEEQRKEQEQVEASIKNYIFNSSEIVKGIPNTKTLQEKVYKTMTEVVSKNPNTGELENKFIKDRSSNPVEFDTRMYYLYELTDGFKDLSKINNTVSSKAVKKLENVLRKTKFEDNGTPGYMQDPNSYNGFGSELVL